MPQQADSIYKKDIQVLHRGKSIVCSLQNCRSFSACNKCVKKARLYSLLVWNEHYEGNVLPLFETIWRLDVMFDKIR